MLAFLGGDRPPGVDHSLGCCCEVGRNLGPYYRSLGGFVYRNLGPYYRSLGGFVYRNLGPYHRFLCDCVYRNLDQQGDDCGFRSLFREYDRGFLCLWGY